MAAYDEYRNSAQPAFQPGRNASTAPLTAPGAVNRQLPPMVQPGASGLPGGMGETSISAQGPQGDLVNSPGAYQPPQGAFGQNPALAALFDEREQAPQEPVDGQMPGMGPSTMPGGMPSVGAFGRAGMGGPVSGARPGQVFGGTSGFGSRIGPFKSGAGSLGSSGAFGGRNGAA
jgi:hypothetical protein